MFWWITFKGGEQGCVQADSKEQAILFACDAKSKIVDEVKSLPYPAHPYLNEIKCEPFCYTPNECAGRSCCPKSYSCVE